MWIELDERGRRARVSNRSPDADLHRVSLREGPYALAKTRRWARAIGLTEREVQDVRRWRGE
jgi:hypothetical protein